MKKLKFLLLYFVLLSVPGIIYSQTGESKPKTVILNFKVNKPNPAVSSLPIFVWSNPDSVFKKIEFPVFEISGIVKSKTRLTGLKIYVNGVIPADGKIFTILPIDEPDAYRISRTLILNEGDNEIKIEAINEKGSTISDPHVINYYVKKIDLLYSEKRLALVIGNANYANGNYLTNPMNDAKDIASVLKEVGFEVMTSIDADLVTMKRTIDEFGIKLKNYNVGLFYYAGHGLQVNGTNYLVPVDASLNVQQDVEYNCVDAGRVLGKMEAAGTTTNIVILDACRKNPFERSWSGRDADQGHGLAFMKAPSGSIIAYSTSPGKTASDGIGKNGLYTESLLQFIRIPSLSIEDFFKNVRIEVEQKSNKEQTPWESTSLKGNFYFKIK